MGSGCGTLSRIDYQEVVSAMLLITLSKLASYPAPLISSLPSTDLQLVPQRPLVHITPRPPLLVVWRQEVAQPATAATNPRATQTGDYIFRACFTDDFQAVVIVRFVLNIGACAAET